MLHDSLRWYEQTWCPGPAIFPFKGNDHLVPCTLLTNHDGPCVPDKHQRDHDCERNGCDHPANQRFLEGTN